MHIPKFFFRPIGVVAVAAMMVSLISCAIYHDPEAPMTIGTQDIQFIESRKAAAEAGDSASNFAIGCRYMEALHMNEALVYFKRGAKLGTPQALEPSSMECAYGMAWAYCKKSAWDPKGDPKSMNQCISMMQYLFSIPFQQLLQEEEKNLLGYPDGHSWLDYPTAERAMDNRGFGWSSTDSYSQAMAKIRNWFISMSGQVQRERAYYRQCDAEYNASVFDTVATDMAQQAPELAAGISSAATATANYNAEKSAMASGNRNAAAAIAMASAGITPPAQIPSSSLSGNKSNRNSHTTQSQYAGQAAGGTGSAGNSGSNSGGATPYPPNNNYISIQSAPRGMIDGDDVEVQPWRTILNYPQIYFRFIKLDTGYWEYQIFNANRTASVEVQYNANGAVADGSGTINVGPTEIVNPVAVSPKQPIVTVQSVQWVRQ